MPRKFRSLVVASTAAALGGAGLALAAASFASSPSIAVSCSTHSFNLGRGGSVTDFAVDCSATDSTAIDSYAVVTAPAHSAAFTLDAKTGVLNYTAAAGYTGVDSVTFTATAGTATSDPTTITFEIANTAPTCPTVGAKSVVHDRLLSVNSGCTDPEKDALSLVAGTVAPAHGSLSFSGLTLKYKPAAKFVGTDHFSFRASDGALGSPEQTVTVQVTDAAPTADAVSVATTHDRARIVTPKVADADGDQLTVAVVAKPQHGTVRVLGNGRFEYKPARHFVGNDTFTFSASDGIRSSKVARVSLTVANHAPRLTDVPAKVTVRSRTAAFSVKTSDADGDAVTLQLATAPKHGTVRISGNKVTYTSARRFHGSDSFVLRATDGVSSVSKSVRVTVR
jgi:hypothetical protein